MSQNDFNNANDQYEDEYEDGYDDDMANDIAIIGMAGRFPMGKDIDEFWTNLVSSQNCITEFSREQLLKMGANPAAVDHPDFVPRAGFTEGQENFDAHFFEFNPREAEQLDPQHRIAMEVAWHCMENAGYAPGRSTHNVGVFAGVNMSTYFLCNILPSIEDDPNQDGIAMQSGVDKDMIATRISYKLNLQGPSVSLGTACSTSLVTTHLACQSLLNGETKMALTGGCHITTPNTYGHIYREGGYSSPDGVCRAFDEKGQGTVGGSGCCFLLLKVLEDAIADNDHIYAVIKGSAVNNDGAEKIGYTAPSIEGQTNIVAEAQAVSGVHPETIRYIEAHGTGTPLGDPIEFTALTRAFRIETEQKNYCAIGSLKTNMGHLGLAAGAAGLIKCALVLNHKIIPESLNYEKPNAKLGIENSPFYVASELEQIEDRDDPIRAGVSSLGIGGTNAHVILEEPPKIDSSESRDFQLVMLSAKTPHSLEKMTSNLADFVSEKVAHFQSWDGKTNKLADVAYTLQVGRNEFDFRRFFVVPNDINNAGDIHKLIAAETAITTKYDNNDKPIVFMFPGGGTQYVNMARDLYNSEPFFKEVMDECAALFSRKGNIDIFDLIFVDDQSRIKEQAKILSRPKLFFAVLFAVEYSLAKLWINWGVKPSAMVGHSLGEYVAATIAGVFNLEDAIGLISYRGDLFDTKVIKGGMISISLPESQVKSMLIDGVSIATINDPDRCVIAGPTDAIDTFETRLNEKAVDYKRLNLGAAGHSALVEPAMPDFRQYINGLTLNEPTIPIVSNISGTWVDPKEICTADYWLKHLRETVRFSDCVNTLKSKGSSIFLEVGPGNSLSSFVRAQVEPNDGHILLNSLRHIKEDKNDQCHILETLGKLWTNGVSINWGDFYKDETRKRLPVPTYAFNSKRYWIEPKKSKTNTREKLPLDDWFSEPAWRFSKQQPHFKEVSDSTWLVFNDKESVTQTAVLSAVEKIKHSAPVIILVEQGGNYEKLSNHHYRINRAVEADYQSLISDLEAQQSIPCKVIHGWCIDEHNKPTDSGEKTPLNYHLRFLYLARRLEAIAKDIEIIALTNHLESVFPNDVVNPDKSLIIGPAKVIPFECAHLSMRVVDVDQSSTKTLIDELLLTASFNESSVALRNDMRFVKTYHAARLEKIQPGEGLIKEGGVYIITGGVGGVGMVHAEALAPFKPRLVLLQRTAFPLEARWDSLLASEDTDSVLAQQIESIKGLKSAGAEVLLIEGDVCNQHSLQVAIDKVKNQWGDINGVIHCAGYGEFTRIDETTPDIIADVLAPKVAGTKNLQTVLGDEPDFILLCSSLSSVTTGFGLVGYVSACAYQDAVAQQHASTSSNTKYITINWDLWNTPQQMAKAKADPTAKAQELKTAILANEGVEVIQRVLHRTLASGSSLSNPQVIVSTKDLNQLVKQNKSLSRAMIDGFETDDLAEEENLTFYDRPALSTPYEAPANDLEELLVSIWQETLGISQIGVLDNFFELGGESLLGVKIVVKAKQHGLNIDPKQMFSKPTIRDAVQLIETLPTIDAEQGVVVGEESCTGIQCDFLSGGLYQPDHWNVGALFSLDKPITNDSLSAIGKRLVNHHDALRTQFKLDESGQWHQVLTDNPIDVVSWIDLSHLNNDDFSQAITTESDILQEQFNLNFGQVFKLTYFNGPDNQSRLLVLAHHLVMDAMSLSILLEDLTQLLLLSHDEIIATALPSKTTSFLEYSRKITASANSDVLNGDLTYWQSTLKNTALDIPRDNSTGKNTERDIDQLSISVDSALTAKLLDKPFKLNELLLFSLGQVIAGWCSNSSVLIDLIGHGREAITEGVDISRTIGWFGSAMPAKLDYNLECLADQLPSLKRQIDAVPNAGIGFNVLKYLSTDHKVRTAMAHMPLAKISLNYLGDISGLMGKGNLLTAAPEPLDNLHASDNQRRYEHDIVAFIEKGSLKLSWSYGHAQNSKATIEQLLNALLKTLESLASAELMSEPDMVENDNVPAALEMFIESTLTTKQQLPPAVLNNLALTEDDIQAFYGATPFQEELYTLNRNQQSAISNIVQGVSVVEGPLSSDLLSAVWGMLITRHSILRTVFTKNLSGELLQVVVNEAKLPLQELDWSDKVSDEHKILTDQLLANDRLTDFDLSNAPALRITLVKLNKDSTKHLILQTNHQIILDGWSSGLLAQDLATCVMSAATMNPVPELDPASYFGSYIQWLSNQSRASVENYWKEKLQGFSCRYLLSSVRRDDVNLSRSRDHYAEYNMDIEQSTIDKLKESSRSSQTTINALFQGAWALTLQQISGSDEVTYGVTVSGRASGDEQVAQVIGQCTNSLPLRLSTSSAELASTTTTQWLQKIHQENLDIQHNNLISLAEIKEIAGLSINDRPYLTNVIFENIPMPSDSGNDSSADMPLRITKGFWTDGWQFPLRLFVVPGNDKIWIRLAYDNGELDSSKVPALTDKLLVNLNKLADNLESPITSLFE